jgi:hypothetical protein
MYVHACERNHLKALEGWKRLFPQSMYVDLYVCMYE